MVRFQEKNFFLSVHKNSNLTNAFHFFSCSLQVTYLHGWWELKKDITLNKIEVVTWICFLRGAHFCTVAIHTYKTITYLKHGHYYNTIIGFYMHINIRKVKNIKKKS